MCACRVCMLYVVYCIFVCCMYVCIRYARVEVVVVQLVYHAVKMEILLTSTFLVPARTEAVPPTAWPCLDRASYQFHISRHFCWMRGPLRLLLHLWLRGQDYGLPIFLEIVHQKWWRVADQPFLLWLQRNSAFNVVVDEGVQCQSTLK